MRPTLVRTAKLAAGSCFDENTALDLVEGQLTDARKEAVLAHAESCEHCRRLLADLAAVEEPAEPKTQTKPPTAVGPWRLDHCVGSGAAGTVYRAHHQHTGQLAAIKLVHDQTTRVRFEREARALAALDHPGIVRYLEHGALADGTMYLVMQWLEGHDLAHHQQALDARSVLDLAMRLAGALAHAHARGCVHRDLSPKNVFLPGGRMHDAMILDFGLVRWVRPDVSQTASQAIVGTPYYMAPEQIRGVYDIDARADLFALGVLLYQASSGRLPFDGDDLLTVWQRIVHAQHPDLGRQAPHLPRAFVDLVSHLLEKAPSDRPPSAQVVWQRLEAIRRGQPDVVRPRRTWYAFATLGLAGLGAAGWLYLHPASKSTSASPTPLGRAAAPSPAAEPDPAPPPAEHLFACHTGKITERAEHYAAAVTRDDPTRTAVQAAASCVATLENCIIDGPRSVSVLSNATLTLKHCKVAGKVTVEGGTLYVVNSDLVQKPQQFGPNSHLVIE